MLAPETLSAIRPGESTYTDVLRLCGQPEEETEELQSPPRRRLVYRGRRTIPQRRLNLGWVATVSHWDIEHHEVVIEFDGDHVRDLQADVRRRRGVPGDDSFPGRR